MRFSPSAVDFFLPQSPVFNEPGFPDGILLFRNGRLADFNRTAGDLLGLLPEILDSPPDLRELIAAPDFALTEILLPTLTQTAFTNLQLHLKGTGSRLLWADAYLKISRSEEQDLLVILFHDISAFRQVQEKLTLIYQAIQQSADTFVITDLDGHVEFVNSAFTQATGYRLDEALGKNPRVLKSGKTPKEVFDDLWKTIKSGRVWKGEVINRRKDGSFYEVELVIAPFFNEEGELSKFIGCHRDITAKKKMQEELVFLEKLSVAGELAPKIAHEMNNQLVVISGKAQKALFLAGNPEKSAKALEETLAEIEAMARQIKNLMNLGKPPVFEIREFSLDEVFTHSIQAIDTTGLLKHITLNWHTDQQNHRIRGDFQSLCQVVNNLLINASHAMPRPGRLHLGVRRNGNRIVGFISDNGHGIPEETGRRIFDPFFTTKAEGKGTGLGLAISKQIVDAHKGEIWFSSRPGKGTIFFLEFQEVINSEVTDKDSGYVS